MKILIKWLKPANQPKYKPPAAITMIRPHNIYLRAFHGLVIVLVIYSAIEAPLQIALEYDHESWLLALDYFVYAVFGIDIVLSFFTAYEERGLLITNRRVVAKKYLKSWFSVDLLAAFPFELILGGYMSSSHKALRVLRLMRLARLLKLVKVHKISRSWHVNRVVNQAVVRLVFFVFWLMLFSHWIACGWIGLGGVNASLAQAEQYLDALYWTVTTLTTVGYGDVTPSTAPQKIYTMITMFLGVATYGYVIGNVSTLLANTDVAKANYVNKIEELTAFFNDKHIPFALQERIKKYYDHLWQSRLGKNEMAILADLPESLRTDVALYLNHDIIRQVPIFKDAGDEIIRELAARLQPKVFLPGDYIVRRGAIGDEMYFVFRGEADLLDSEGRPIKTFTQGTFFGEAALLFKQPRNADIRSRGFSDVYTLSKETFQQLLSEYPDFARKMRDLAKKRSMPT